MISTLNKISNDHNSCEDNFTYRVENNIISGVVSDGCSTGKNSEFASKLLCYLFAREKIDYTRGDVITDVFLDLRYFKYNLLLHNHNLWATLVLFYYNIETEVLLVRVLGDGVYYINDVEFIVDKNDKVDYLIDQIFIHEYLLSNPVQIYENVTSFRICSDGIKSLKLPSLKTSNIENPKEFLLSKNESENHLSRKYNILKKQNWLNTDDLTIIAYDKDI